ncbi:MAG: hypothetical protein HY062_14540 [Bacteroidetes bacterium]|nr:hypothetical protein [Bacteroidota bacterium]
MKTKIIITAFILTLFSRVCYTQSLFIKGIFKNQKDEMIEVNYLLVSNGQVLYSGTGKKIKTELDLDNDYILVVSKNGYVTKSISFSTHTNDKDHFCFEFDLYLYDFPGKNGQQTLLSASVYYDSRLRSFNYNISGGKNLQN